MELESNKYKKRLIIIVVIAIISMLLGNIANQAIKSKAEYIDKWVAAIQGTTEEEYNEAITRKEENGEDVSNMKTKEEALNIFQPIQNFYDNIYKNGESVAILMFSFAICGSIIGILMSFIFLGWIINKVWIDIKLWLSIIMRILILVIALPIPIFQYVLITIGVFGQIPYAAYTLYKYIKIKKAEDKDDVIIEK